MEYSLTVGLEIHVELKTASKMFCSCKNDPNELKPNTNVCSICLGHPGTLPVLNKEAIKHVLKIGVAVNGQLADFTEWDRKNYFYPDIPKGYQISQYKYPLISGGELAGVAIERIHLEEDTAQSTHDVNEKSLVNFNRSGVPLMELVTKPVIHDAATTVHFAKELQLLLRYLGTGDANMEKGEMRVEANISVASDLDTKAERFGTKTEVKNLNSFRAVERAIEYEVARQTKILESGKHVIQETRGWDDGRNETYSQRGKESSHDYRYFPEPDIPKLKLSEIEEFSPAELKEEIPELPWTKRSRMKEGYGMTDKEVEMLVDSPTLSKYYESIIGNRASGKGGEFVRLVTNYFLTDYLGILKKEKLDIESSLMTISPKSFGGLIEMIEKKKISSRGAKDLLVLLMKDGGSSPEEIAKKHGLLQQSSTENLAPAIEKVIADNAKAVNEYKSGKVASLQYLIGQAMKATKGAGNPAIVKDLLVKRLS